MGLLLGRILLFLFLVVVGHHNPLEGRTYLLVVGPFFLLLILFLLWGQLLLFLSFPLLVAFLDKLLVVDLSLVDHVVVVRMVGTHLFL